jgi:hypothetical protein
MENALAFLDLDVLGSAKILDVWEEIAEENKFDLSDKKLEEFGKFAEWDL